MGYKEVSELCGRCMTVPDPTGLLRACWVDKIRQRNKPIMSNDDDDCYMIVLICIAITEILIYK